MNCELVAEILALPASEHVRLADAIWDSIAAAPEALELTQRQKDELDRRLAEFEADPIQTRALRWKKSSLESDAPHNSPVYYSATSRARHPICL